MFASDLAAGRLVVPFAAASAPSGFGYYLTVHPDGAADPTIRLFRSWVMQRYARCPPAGPRSR